MFRRWLTAPVCLLRDQVGLAHRMGSRTESRGTETLRDDRDGLLRSRLMSKFGASGGSQCHVPKRASTEAAVATRRLELETGGVFPDETTAKRPAAPPQRPSPSAPQHEAAVIVMDLAVFRAIGDAAEALLKASHVVATVTASPSIDGACSAEASGTSSTAPRLSPLAAVQKALLDIYSTIRAARGSGKSATTHCEANVTNTATVTSAKAFEALLHTVVTMPEWTHDVLASEPPCDVLSVCCLLEALRQRVTAADAVAAGQSSTRDEATVMARMDEHVWQMLSQCCATWLQKGRHRALDTSNNATPSPFLHVLRNCARLKNLWMKRHDEVVAARANHYRAQLPAHPMSIAERVAASYLLCMTLHVCSDLPYLAEQPARVDALIDVAQGLYRLAEINPWDADQVIQSESPSAEWSAGSAQSTATSSLTLPTYCHRTIHSSLNVRLIVTELARRAATTAGSGANLSSPVDRGSAVDTAAGAVLLLPFILLNQLVEVLLEDVMRNFLLQSPHASTCRPKLSLVQHRCLIQVMLALEGDCSMLLDIMEPSEGSQGRSGSHEHHISIINPNPQLRSDGTVGGWGAAAKKRLVGDGDLREGEVDDTSDATAKLRHALAQLRECIAEDVLAIVTKLTVAGPDGRPLTNLSAVRKQAANGEAIVLSAACVFLQHLQRSFLSLPRRHFMYSNGRDVLEPALKALCMVYCSAEELRPVVVRKKDPWFVKVGPAGFSVGVLMEVLYFASLLKRSHGDDAATSISWEPTAVRMFHFAADALLLNSFRLGKQVDSEMGGAAPLADPVGTIFSLDREQFWRPSVLRMPLWQLSEWMVTVHAFYGSLAVQVPEKCNALFSSLSPAPEGTTATAEERALEQMRQMRRLLTRRVHEVQELGSALQKYEDSADEDKSAEPASKRRRKMSAKRKKGIQIRGSMSFDSGEAAERAKATALMGELGVRGTLDPNVATSLMERVGSRIKSLSSMAEHVGLDFSAAEEHQQMSRQKAQRRRAAAAVSDDSSISGVDAAATSSSDVPVGGVTVGKYGNLRLVLLREPGTPLGVALDADGVVVDVPRGQLMAVCLTEAGMLSSDIVGMRITAVGGRAVESSNDIVSTVSSIMKTASGSGKRHVRIVMDLKASDTSSGHVPSPSTRSTNLRRVVAAEDVLPASEYHPESSPPV